ncbi:MAG: PAS domain-containing protein [Gammaproteobacteria bacterium]|nr:PAS domain-containing protein [Gammaproteobacteria bacterium]
MASFARGSGHWTLYAEGQSAKWSDETYRIFGTPPVKVPSPQVLSRLVHPDDCRGVMNSLERSLAQAVEHNMDYRIIRPDGEKRWVNCRARPVLNTGGSVMKLEDRFDTWERLVDPDDLERSWTDYAA